MKWKTLSMVLLLVVLFSSSVLFGLTEEEKKTLPTLSKTELIQIIMLYDQQLIETENSLIEREKILEKREKETTETEKFLLGKEKTLTESEAHIRLRESLLVTSFQLQKEANSQNFWTGILYGVVAGGVGGYFLPSP